MRFCREEVAAKEEGGTEDKLSSKKQTGTQQRKRWQSRASLSGERHH